MHTYYVCKIIWKPNDVMCHSRDPCMRAYARDICDSAHARLTERGLVRRALALTRRRCGAAASDFLEALRLEATVFPASLGVRPRPCGDACSPWLSSTGESTGSSLPSRAWCSTSSVLACSPWLSSESTGARYLRGRSQ